MSEHRAPSKLLWVAEAPRAAWTMLRLAAARRRRAKLPRGDGRPILLLPGLVQSDSAMVAMRRFLVGLGYDARTWGLGRNLGPRTIGADAERLVAAVERLHRASGAQVTLIGSSLGGMMARLVAARRPDLVRAVITVASPYAGSPRATNVWRAFEWATRQRVDDPALAALQREYGAPLKVPAHAIWSRSDGLVNGLICHDPADPGTTAHEVQASHLAVQMNPDVLRRIALILAEG